MCTARMTQRADRVSLQPYVKVNKCSPLTPLRSADLIEVPDVTSAGSLGNTWRRTTAIGKDILAISTTCVLRRACDPTAMGRSSAAETGR